MSCCFSCAQARKAISLRAQMEKKVAQKDREGKEERLRDLARVARDKRVGIHGVGGEKGERGGQGEGEEEESAEAVRERDILRQERHKERERERRLARAHPEKRSVYTCIYMYIVEQPICSCTL